jgi:starch-binding outer membrane protein, SusD/RagB family
MKNKIFNGIIAMGFVAVALSSCEKDRLSPVLQTSISDAVAFSSPDRILADVVGMYSAVKSGQFLGGRTLVYNDVRGEEFINVLSNGVTAFATWNFSVQPSTNEVENMWSAAYAAINRINVVIEGINNNPGVVSASLANQYIAEARFLRALSYHYLVTLYSKKPYTADNGASLGVPLRLVALKGSAGAELARNTVSEVYTQILSDLDFAEANLPLTYAAAGDVNTVRAHRNSAIALKTRVRLNMGDYAGVITEGTKLVPQATAPFSATTGRAHALSPSILTPFRAPHTAIENIFALPMASTNAPGTQNDLALYWGAEYQLNEGVTGIFNNAGWPATDARRTNFNAVLSGRNHMSLKYTSGQTDYVKIMRYSEVMLNLAEALARQSAGIDAKALALLNAVRQRSNPATTFVPLSKQELIDLILLERRIEFLGEGLRSMDIMRLGMAFPAKSGANGSVSAIPTTSNTYVWPIPSSELLFNTLAVQN